MTLIAFGNLASVSSQRRTASPYRPASARIWAFRRRYRPPALVVGVLDGPVDVWNGLVKLALLGQHNGQARFEDGKLAEPAPLRAVEDGLAEGDHVGVLPLPDNPG